MDQYRYLSVFFLKTLCAFLITPHTHKTLSNATIIAHRRWFCSVRVWVRFSVVRWLQPPSPRILGKSNTRDLSQVVLELDDGLSLGRFSHLWAKSSISFVPRLTGSTSSSYLSSSPSSSLLLSSPSSSKLVQQSMLQKHWYCRYSALAVPLALC